MLNLEELREDARKLREESNQVLKSAKLANAAMYAEAAVKALQSGNEPEALRQMEKKDEWLAPISAESLRQRANRMRRDANRAGETRNVRTQDCLNRASKKYELAAAAAERGDRVQAASQALLADLDLYNNGVENPA